MTTVFGKGLRGRRKPETEDEVAQIADEANLWWTRRDFVQNPVVRTRTTPPPAPAPRPAAVEAAPVVDPALSGRGFNEVFTTESLFGRAPATAPTGPAAGPTAATPATPAPPHGTRAARRRRTHGRGTAAPRCTAPAAHAAAAQPSALPRAPAPRARRGGDLARRAAGLPPPREGGAPGSHR